MRCSSSTIRRAPATSLRFVPRDKAVVLGIVSSKTPALESQDELVGRIEEATRHVPIERLALSPCGFASTVAGNSVTEDDEKRKLARIVEVANAVWRTT